MSDKSNAVRVEALRAHTYNGKAYEVGDEYDFYPSDNPSSPSVDEQVASLANTGFALRVDRVKVAKAQAKAAETSQKAAAPKAARAKSAKKK